MIGIYAKIIQFTNHSTIKFSSIIFFQIYIPTADFYKLSKEIVKIYKVKKSVVEYVLLSVTTLNNVSHVCHKVRHFF